MLFSIKKKFPQKKKCEKYLNSINPSIYDEPTIYIRNLHPRYKDTKIKNKQTNKERPWKLGNSDSLERLFRIHRDWGCKS